MATEQTTPPPGEMPPMGDPEVLARNEALLREADEQHDAGQHSVLCQHLAWFRRSWIGEIRNLAVRELAHFEHSQNTNWAALLIDLDRRVDDEMPRGRRLPQKPEIPLIVEESGMSAEDAAACWVETDEYCAARLVTACDAALTLTRPSQILQFGVADGDAELLQTARRFFTNLERRAATSASSRAKQRRAARKRTDNILSGADARIMAEYERETTLRIEARPRRPLRGVAAAVAKTLGVKGYVVTRARRRTRARGG